MAQTLLHGVIYAAILEVNSLPTYSPSASTAPPPPTKPLRKVVEVMGKRPARIYVTIDLEKARVGRTRMTSDPTNSRWNESFRIYCAYTASNIVFTLKSNNPIDASVIGRAHLPVGEILTGMEADRWLVLWDESRRPLTGAPKIHVKLMFLHVSKDPSWGRELSSDYPGVPYTYFVQRKGCKVTLYQDAHVSTSFAPRYH